MRDLGLLNRRGRRPLRRLGELLSELGPASRALGAPVRKLTPVAKALGRHRQGPGDLGANWSGVFSTNDGNGPVLRGLGFWEPVNPANLGVPTATASQRATLDREVVRALESLCLQESDLACLARYLVPGLPGSVRSGADPLGDPQLAAASAHGGTSGRPRGDVR
jgi:hypothetical protein